MTSTKPPIPTKLLVLDLQSDNPRKRLEAGLAVGQQAQLSSALQVSLVDGGVIPPLVRQLKEYHGQERAQAATSLARLVKGNAAGQSEVVMAGAVAPLRRQLMASTALQRTAAATCISRLVENNPENQRAFAVEGTARPLISLLIAETTEERTQAAVALGQMAKGHPDNQSRLTESGAVEHLAALLRAEEGLERDCASFSLANILDISYDQVIADISRAREVDVAIQIWNNLLAGRKRLANIAPPKKNPKFSFRSSGIPRGLSPVSSMPPPGRLEAKPDMGESREKGMKGRGDDEHGAAGRLLALRRTSSEDD
eukprot:s903_g7.t1